MNSKQLSNKLKNLPHGWVVLVETSSDKALRLNMEVMANVIETKHFGIILETNNSAEEIIHFFRKKKVSPSQFIIIDCVTKKCRENPNIIYLESCNKLTETAITINSLLNISEKRKVVFINTLNTLLLYNNKEYLLKFVHSIITTFRLAHVNCVLFSMKGSTDAAFRDNVSQLCDETIMV